MNGQAIGVVLLGGSEGSFVTVLALPKPCARWGGAGSVVIGGRGAERFFSVVVTHECEFDQGREEEEDNGNDRNGETGSLELTGLLEAGETC